MATDSQTHLIKHLETGKCAQYPDFPTDIVRILGKWYYSVLYMDIDLHAQIRQGRANIGTVMECINDNVFVPYVCRAEGCGQTFKTLRSLAHHWEFEDCMYTVDRLKLDRLWKEIKRNLQEEGNLL